MSVRILDCPKCHSKNIIDIDRSETEKKVIIAKVKAKCDDCSHEFTYGSATDYGRRRNVFY